MPESTVLACAWLFAWAINGFLFVQMGGMGGPWTLEEMNRAGVRF